MFQENCYVVSDDTKESVIIDCGAFYDEEKQAIAEYIGHDSLTVRHLLVTHGHIDHNYGNGFVYEQYGLKPLVHGGDEPLMCRLREQSVAFIGVPPDGDMPPVGRYITDEDTVSFGNHTLTVIPAPGHSPGSVVFHCREEGVAFTGDTLFRMGIGRTDLMLGSYEDIISSLHMLLAALPDDTVVLSGHGPQTTIADEKKMNPFVK